MLPTSPKKCLSASQSRAFSPCSADFRLTDSDARDRSLLRPRPENHRDLVEVKRAET